MSLSDRFKESKTRKATSDDPEVSSQKVFFQDAKFRLHQKLIERLDLEALGTLDPNEARLQVTHLVKKILQEERLALSSRLQQDLIQEVVNETFGLGPLEPLLATPSIDEILVNGPKQVYIEQYGKLSLTNVTFKDDQHLRNIISRIVSAVGRRIDESSPMVDARLADGSRVNAIIPPLALDGPTLSIRRFKDTPLVVDDMIRYGSLNERMRDYLKTVVDSKLNVLISGGTGTGKTTMLNVVSRFIPDGERIITIEDAAELQLQQPHVVRLETRPPNIEGKGAVTQTELLKNSLRMRPDRIVVGEVRGTEAMDMLQAMNTGHEGSLTTVHANTARDAITRIETMVLMGSANLTHMAIMRQIASAIHVILQIKRYSDGTRKVSSITELVGLENDVVLLQEVVKFEETDVGANGKISGRFVFNPTGSKFVKV
jgi:pilus assembly protein CpaF